MEYGYQMMNNTNQRVAALVQGARTAGASEAVVVWTKDIVIEDGLADNCLNPRCENYGLSTSCPPHVKGPQAFRKQLETFDRAVCFKIDVPSEIMYSSDRREIFQLLHELAAGIEHTAVEMGFENARAYAGGSCKHIFCYDHLECAALLDKAKCRNPQHARPSMSGFGINVARLMKTAGWSMSMGKQDPDPAQQEMANVCGLVLVC